MKHLIWTMQNELSKHWQDELNQNDVYFSHFPTIQFKKIEISTEKLQQIPKNTNGILLTSRTAARFFINLLFESKLLKNINIYTISDSAKKLLKEKNIDSEKIADHRTGLEVGDIFMDIPKSGFELIHLCSQITPPCNWQNLEHLGITIERVPIYNTLTFFQPAMISLLKDGGTSMIVFSSPSGIDGFIDHFESRDEGKSYLSNLDIAVLGKSTESKLTDNGINNYIRSDVPDTDQLMNNIMTSNFIMEEINEFTG